MSRKLSLLFPFKRVTISRGLLYLEVCITIDISECALQEALHSMGDSWFVIKHSIIGDEAIIKAMARGESVIENYLYMSQRTHR